MRKLFVITLILSAITMAAFAQGRQTSPPPPPAPAVVPAQTAIVPVVSQTPPTDRGGRGQTAGAVPTTPTPPPGRGRWEPPAQNVRIEIAITDKGDRTTRKIVSMLVADGDNGRIRSGNNTGLLNIDGRAQVGSDGRIYLSLTIEYAPDRSPNATTTTLNESVSLVIAQGRPTLISQSADPGTDRVVSVEVSAVVVK